jgi:integrase
VGGRLRHGDRHIKTYARKKDADAFHANVRVDVERGIHTAESKSVTVAKAAELFVQSCVDLERSTLQTYRQHIDLHIVPLLGDVKLSQLSTPMVREFADRLRHSGRSQAMVSKILVRLGSILADAQERGLVGQNVVRSLRAQRQRRRKRQAEPSGKLRRGIDIPTPDEVRAIIAQLHGRWRPLILTAVFTGLRASELRGLRWADVDLKRGELHVTQRADRYNEMGPPKSEAGERVVPMPPILVNTLREHKLASRHDLVFPGPNGGVDSYNNIKRGFAPAQIAAGVSINGKAKYGMHALRHFFASWCINRKVDGGLELPMKLVQARLGHATISMTADTYGHLFPRGDDAAELAAAERVLLG